MKHISMKLKHLWPLPIITLIALNCRTIVPPGTFPYASVDSFQPHNVRALSDVYFHPDRKTFYAVNDKGYVIEISADGTLLQERRINEEFDFEGITFNSLTGLLYVAIEGDEVILEVNPLTLEPGRQIPIDRMFEGSLILDPGKDGVEGITFVPASDNAFGGTFYLVNQSDDLGGKDPSIVFEVGIDLAADRPIAKILRYFSIGVTDLSAIHYLGPGQDFLIVSDSNDLLLEVSLSGAVKQSYKIPGVNQEGVTLDDQGFLYIAQDKNRAIKLLKFKPIF